MPICLRDVIKSPDVEDPVNLHVHRPLQLALVRPLVSTRITPDQVTYASLACGLASAAFIVVGTPVSLVAAAALLFGSAILDGVDGMLARLKKTSSETGHALDGAADYVVNVATTGAAVYHLAVSTGQPLVALALGLGAHVAWAHHLMLYDFHCANFLRFASGGRHQGGNLARAEEIVVGMRARGASSFRRAVMAMYVWQLGNRERFLRLVVPSARAVHDLAIEGDGGARYVATHRASMRFWALLGNAPHMDLMALAVATDHVEVYFVLRIVGFTLLAIGAALWARRVAKRFVGGAVAAVSVPLHGAR